MSFSYGHHFISFCVPPGFCQELGMLPPSRDAPTRRGCSHSLVMFPLTRDAPIHGDAPVHWGCSHPPGMLPPTAAAPGWAQPPGDVPAAPSKCRAWVSTELQEASNRAVSETSLLHPPAQTGGGGTLGLAGGTGTHRGRALFESRL